MGGPVDDDMANLIVAQLLYLDSAGKQDITMYVNSPGGSVTAGIQNDLLSSRARFLWNMAFYCRGYQVENTPGKLKLIGLQDLVFKCNSKPTHATFVLGRFLTG